MHIIYSTQKCTLYPLFRLSRYIFYTEMHIISSSRNSHYILFTKIHISSIQINTINPSLQISTICFLFLQIYTVYYRLRKPHYILFSDIKTIFSSQKYTLYTLFRNAHYILFSDKHIIFSTQKCTLYPLPGKHTITTVKK